MKRVRAALIACTLCVLMFSTSPAPATPSVSASVTGFPSALRVCITSSTLVPVTLYTASLQVTGAAAFTPVPSAGVGGIPIVDAPVRTGFNVSTLTACSQSWDVRSTTGALTFSGQVSTATQDVGARACAGVVTWQHVGVPSITSTCV